MKLPNFLLKLSISVFMVAVVLLSFGTQGSHAQDIGDQCVNGKINGKPCIQVNKGADGLNFNPPGLAEILTFAIRLIFIIGGLAALVMLLLGAFTWITSGGEKDKVEAAQKKIQAAVLGVIMIAVVLAVVVTLEQVVFAGKICLGLSCGITIPALLKDAPPS